MKSSATETSSHSIKQIQGQALRLFFIWIALFVFTFTPLAQSSFKTPFDQLDLEGTFGPLSQEEKDTLEYIWGTLYRLTEHADPEFTDEVGPEYEFSNLQTDKLQIEFMHFFLFRENYHIQIFRPGDTIKPQILKALRKGYPARDKRAVRWVFSDIDQYILGAGTNEEARHSILANYYEELETLTPKEKLELIINPLNSAKGIASSGAKSMGRYHMGLDKADILHLQNITHSGHYKPRGKYLFSNRTGQALNSFYTTLGDKHNLHPVVLEYSVNPKKLTVKKDWCK